MSLEEERRCKDELMVSPIKFIFPQNNFIMDLLCLTLQYKMGFIVYTQ